MSDIKTEENMLSYIEKNKYLVVYPDKTAKIYQSLREIEKDILISSSNISKKINNKIYGEDYCICIAKGTKYVFFIKKLIN
ncbi:MAG: hypothetical protein CXT73_04760 [Methanobacteriota archaeon]|nr:MAG: hypothetical protein CXT73_04760 [Euryarchaeota archaeon]